MSKQDRQGVRTPADIERKYNLGALSKGGGDSGQLSQINQALSQFMADTNAKIVNCVTKEEMDGIVYDAILEAKENGEFDDIGGGSLSASVQDDVLVIFLNLTAEIKDDVLILS